MACVARPVHLHRLAGAAVVQRVLWPGALRSITITVQHAQHPTEASALHTVKLNVHPEDCACERSPNCRGKYVVNMPDTSLEPHRFTDVDAALALIREYAVQGPPLGKPGVRGHVRTPNEDKLRGR